MATSLAGQVALQVSVNYQNSLDLRSVVDNFSKNITMNLANGSGADQATVIWADTRTTDNTGETLDFNGGGLVDAFGLAVAITKWVCVIVQAATTNGAINVVVTRESAGGGLFNLDTAGISLPPGAWFAAGAPAAAHFPATAGDLDSLKIAAASAGNVTYDIVVIGAA